MFVNGQTINYKSVTDSIKFNSFFYSDVSTKYINYENSFNKLNSELHKEFLIFLSSNLNLSNDNLKSCSNFLKQNQNLKKFNYVDSKSRFLKIVYTLPLQEKNIFISSLHSNLLNSLNSFCQKYSYKINDNIYINNSNVNQILNQFYTINKLISNFDFLPPLLDKSIIFFNDLELDYNRASTLLDMLNSANSKTSLSDLLNIEESYLENVIKLESIDKLNTINKLKLESLIKNKSFNCYELNLKVKDYSAALFYFDFYCKRFDCSLQELNAYNSLKYSTDSLNYINEVLNIPKLISNFNSSFNNEKYLDAMILVQKLKSFNKKDLKDINLEKIEKKCLKKMNLKDFDIYSNDDYLKQISKNNFVGTFRDDGRTYNLTQLKQAALDDLISQILVNISTNEVNLVEDIQINNRSSLTKKYFNKTILKSEIELINLSFIKTSGKKYNRVTVFMTKKIFFKNKLNQLSLLIDENCSTKKTNDIYLSKIKHLFSILSISNFDTSNLLYKHSKCN